MSATNKSFNQVISLIDETVKGFGFEAYKGESEEAVTEKDGAVFSKYVGEKGVIELKYENEVVTLLYGDDSAAPENTPTRLTASLLSEDADTKDINYVANDLKDSLTGKFSAKAIAKAKNYSQKTPQTVSKNAVKNGSFYDPNTLASKLCLVFPELREPYRLNIEKYGDFLSEEFFTEYATEKIIDAIKQNKPQTMKKMFQILNEIYEDGTNDTQSLIAVTILGELNNDTNLLARCVDYMSETMAPPVIEVNKYLATRAGKRARKKMLNPPPYKPKKKKKPNAFMQAMASSGGAMPPM